MNRHVIAIAVIAVFVAGAGYFVTRGSEKPAATEAAEKEEAHEEGQIKLSAEQVEKAGITLQLVAAGVIRETISLYGAVTANAERTREVSARFPGTLRNVSKQLGDGVRQGEALATVESNESLQAYAVTAPINGVVTARNANPGEQTGDKVLFTVSDLSTVWVELSLFPRDAAKVHVGQSVIIKSADNGVSGEGKVTYIAPLSSAANQTRSARVLLDNTDGRWSPGLYVNAEVVLGQVDVPAAVRTEALQDIGGAESVFVRTAEGFETRALKLGRRDSEHAEVLEGVEPGENYASTNSFILKAERGKSEIEDED